jgi:CubicO group peptidase (beta-lactamase class C family)
VWWLQPSYPAPQFHSAGQGLWSTISDYLQFARLLLGKGTLDGVELLSPSTFARFTRNVLTDKQRRDPVLGWPVWLSMGFGLGVAVLTDPENIMASSPGSIGSYTWPGILGTWWQVDPQVNAIFLYFSGLVSVSAVAAAAPGARGQTLFRKLAYDQIELRRSR